MAVAARAEHQVEGLAPVHQCVDGIVELARRRGLSQSLNFSMLAVSRGTPSADGKVEISSSASPLLGHGEQRQRLGGKQRVERALA